MKFSLDEGISPAVAAPLREVFLNHEFTDTRTEGLTEMKDLPLFEEMRARHVDVFVTLDTRQLSNRQELAALRRGGFHWFGMAQPSGSGVSALARQASSLLLATAYLLDNPPDVKTAFAIRAAGRQGGQLFSRQIALEEARPGMPEGT